MGQGHPADGDDLVLGHRFHGSSFRQYSNYSLNEPVPQVTVPAAVTLSGEPAYAMYPRSLAERVFTDLRRWNAPHRGGPFMAHEEPEQVASGLRAFFRPLGPGCAPRPGSAGSGSTFIISMASVLPVQVPRSGTLRGVAAGSMAAGQPPAWIAEPHRP